MSAIKISVSVPEDLLAAATAILQENDPSVGTSKVIQTALAIFVAQFDAKNLELVIDEVGRRAAEDAKAKFRNMLGFTEQ